MSILTDRYNELLEDIRRATDPLVKKRFEDELVIVEAELFVEWSNQTVWYIDPLCGVNMTPEGFIVDGLTPCTAVKTFSEIVRRWQTTSPTFNQDVNIRWLNEPEVPAADPVNITPTLLGGAQIFLYATTIALTPFPGVIQVGVLPPDAIATVNTVAALSSLPSAGLPEGTSVFVQSLRTTFQLTFNSSLAAYQNQVVASDVAGRVWVRSQAPTSWTYQFTWYYDKDNGNDENDGATITTPIRSFNELGLRLRMFGAGYAGVRAQYSINLLSDVAATDTLLPSGITDPSGVQFTANNDLVIGFNILGNRRATLTVPGGTGLLTANSILATPASNSKATLEDATGNFSTLVGNLVMCADTATAATSSGAAGTIASVTGGLATFTGGSGFITGSVNRLITISGAATAANNGTFPITRFISATSVEYSNPNAVAGDANNGAISWVQKPAKVAWIVNAPAFTSGTGITVSAVNAGIATLVGAPAATFVADSVGKRIRLSNGIAANNGTFTIVAFISGTSVQIANANAVVDATVQNFNGVVEVGASWYDQVTTFESAAAPLSGSPYVLVKLASMSQILWGGGMPRGFVPTVNNVESSAAPGTISTIAWLNFVRMTDRGWLPGGRGTVLSQVAQTNAVNCCWYGGATPFVTSQMFLQEYGYLRLIDSCLVNHRLRVREKTTGLLLQNSLIQGGFIACAAGDESGPRPGSGLGIVYAGTKAAGIFNNVNGSATQPAISVGPSSAGFALIIGRDGLLASAGSSFPFGPSVLWGVGVNGGVHVKESSKMLMGTTAVPTITDTPGLAGAAINQLKIDNQPPLPVVSSTTGVPTAATVSAVGVATTFTAASGLITILDAGMTFTAASVGRTVTIAGANNAANNGTYPIIQFLGATSVVIRNPAGVTDAVAAGTTTENPVVTRWAQLQAAPYSGNVVNQVNNTTIAKVAES